MGSNFFVVPTKWAFLLPRKGGSMKKLLKRGAFIAVFVAALLSNTSYGMHIMEGFLPKEFCLLWGVVSLPFLIVGIRKLTKEMKEHPNNKTLLGLVGGFVFVLSALKIPSVTGSCSHPTGVGLGAMLFGPTIMVVIGAIVLVFQALLLAHGGITTLGANIFSMAIVGPFVAYGIYRLFKKNGWNITIGVFLAAFLSDLLTYVTTAGQLALAYPSPSGGFVASFGKFLGIFAVTQVPLAIVEGLVTVLVMKMIFDFNEKGVIKLES